MTAMTEPKVVDTDGRIDTVLRLSHDAAHWAGTFQVVLTALCEDLLSDGPLPVTVEFLNGDPDGPEVLACTATLTGIDEQALTFADRDPLPRPTVLAVAF